MAGYSLIAAVKPTKVGVVRRGGGVRADSVGTAETVASRSRRKMRINLAANKKLLYSKVLTKAVAGAPSHKASSVLAFNLLPTGANNEIGIV